MSLDLKGLYANSPVASVACVLIGIANGAWGTLGAVYGARIGISTPEIALMMSLVVVAGAAMQLPVGRVSDKTDRRFVLAAASLGSAVFALLVFVATPRSGVFVIAMTACYGALAYTLYSSPSPTPTTTPVRRILSRSRVACCCSTASGP